MKGSYYVYQLAIEGKDAPFYVGKGTGPRALSHLKIQMDNNPYKCNIVNKAIREGKQVELSFLWDNLSNEEAMRREVWAIKMWGRKDLGEGPLVNMTDGAEGVSGRVWGEESKAKLSASRMGIGKGVKQTEEHIRARVVGIKDAFEKSPEKLKRRNERIKESHSNPETKQKKLISIAEHYKSDAGMLRKEQISSQTKARWSDPIKRGDISKAMKLAASLSIDTRVAIGKEVAKNFKENVCAVCGVSIKGPSFWRHVKTH